MSDWREFLLALGHDLDDVKVGVRTKLDIPHYDELEEWSNKLTNGNLSAMARVALVLGLERLTEVYDGTVPSLAIVNKGRRQWVKEQVMAQRLQKGAAELRQHYTKEYEQSLRNFAKQEGLEWPPPDEDYKVVDPTVKRVLERLTTVLNEKKTATLRDVYSGLSGLGADDARQAVIDLEELGVVHLTGSRQAYGTLEISWAEMMPSD